MAVAGLMHLLVRRLSAKRELLIVRYMGAVLTTNAVADEG